MRDRIKPSAGSIRLYTVDELRQRLALADGLPRWDDAEGCPAGWNCVSAWLKNAVLYDYAFIVIQNLLRKGLNYGIGGMYIEFENVASPGDTVAAPDFTRGPGEGIDYYNGLADSSVRDYLRVPLTAGSISSSDETLFPLGNIATFFAQTAGTTGVHGKPWSAAANSVAFGAALVAFVDDEDVTQDIVYARAYLDASKQPAKQDPFQVGIQWRQIYE